MSQAENLQELRQISFADFEDYDDPDVAGVYALWDTEDELLYIGQSGTVGDRLRAHRRKGWRIARTAVYPLGDLERRLILEAILMLTERPRYNKALLLNLRGRVSEIRYKRKRNG